MDVSQSTPSRRLRVRLDFDEDLLEALSGLLSDEGIRSAWVRGVGTLVSIELDGLGKHRGVELLHLEGRIAAGQDESRHLFASVAEGGRVIGGRLKGAVAGRLELVVEVEEEVTTRALVSPARDAQVSWADVAAASEEKASDAPVSWADVAAASEEKAAAPVSWADVAAASDEKAAPPRRTAPAEPSWADVAAVSEVKQRSAEREEVTELIPGKGDFIQHRQFGLCRVDKEDGNGNVVLRLPSGIRKKIKLAYMDVGRPRMEGNKRVFAIRPRKR